VNRASVKHGPQFLVVGTRPDKLWRKAFKTKVHLKFFAKFAAAKLPQRGIKRICQPAKAIVSIEVCRTEYP
jgi:hypothetical protein